MSDLVAVIENLDAQRERLLRMAGLAGEAVSALKLLAEEMEPAPRALPPARPAQHPAPAAAAPAPSSTRPTTGRCQYEPCGKRIEIATIGRRRRFCNRTCAVAAREHARTAIAEHRARGADPVDEVLHREEPIPESGLGMKARIKRALDSADSAPPSRFLATIRGRNDEAARRSAASR